ncbi:MAG: hypothetical protein KBD83_08940 [Gammaproteobacteria bacterium]|nr:hypothetical protein [Gammaproteobacteria bacterium]
MSFCDFFVAFVILSIVSAWIYFIIEIFRGNVKWTDRQNNPNPIFDHQNYYHYSNRTDVLLTHDLHHRYSYHDEDNISNDRSPDSI